MKQILFAGIALLFLAISCNQASEKERSQTANMVDLKMHDVVTDTAAVAFEQAPATPGREKQKADVII